MPRNSPSHDDAPTAAAAAATAVTHAATDLEPSRSSDGITLVPLIGDILRTRYCTPGSLFLVEDVATVSVSRSGRWRAVRLLLGDGEICIQSLLSGAMHRFVETGVVAAGCYVRVDQCRLGKKKISPAVDDDEHSEQGKGLFDGSSDRPDMVYLVVDDLVTVGWNDGYRSMWQQRHQGGRVRHNASIGLIENEPSLRESRRERSGKEANETDDSRQGLGVSSDRGSQITHGVHADDSAAAPEEDDEDDLDDAFETFENSDVPSQKSSKIPPSTATKRDSGSALAPATASRSSNKSSRTHPSQAVALHRDWVDPQVPLKLTTLRSIPHLPYAQNWSCNVLAIVTSLSAIEPSNLPPYRQRTARLADPSTAKNVHLTVFLDPDQFEPALGSAVLLVGVKNHRFDGGCLKKYQSDETPGRSWWFENPWELTWCDVAGIRRWWCDMQGIREADRRG